MQFDDLPSKQRNPVNPLTKVKIADQASGLGWRLGIVLQNSNLERVDSQKAWGTSHVPP